MVKRLLVRIIYEYGSKALNSVFKAYKDTVKSAPKTGAENKQSGGEEKQKSAFGKFNFNNLIATPMTKDESVKILNLKESEATPENIMERFEKYFESNDPMKGGSFYIQNKIYYAKEYLMEKYPRDLNKSKLNPDSYSASSSNPKDEKAETDSKTNTSEDETVEKNKNTKI